MASWMGMDVYRDTTSRLHGYGSVLLSLDAFDDPVNLRLYEAYYIRKHKPGLNSREECTELNDLLF